MMRASNSRTDSQILIVKHAATLPNADGARKLLERIRRNADAILRSRGWRVVELVELCCCKEAPEKAHADTEGWCIADSSLQNTMAEKIAIRLREPKGKGHRLLDFESVFGCMIHELTHIIHDKHTKAFHRLMDELQEEWERLEAAGRVLDENGFPTIGGHRIDSSPRSSLDNVGGFVGVGRVLGGGSASSSSSTPLDVRERNAQAAERRARFAGRCGSGSAEGTQAVPAKRRFCGCHFSSAAACKCETAGGSASQTSAAVGSSDADLEQAIQLSMALERSAALAAQEEERALQIALAVSEQDSMALSTAAQPPAPQPIWHTLKGRKVNVVLDLSDDD
eukprot:TRINITY_DN20788_c0_g1_i1.p1 TRINITY_DN20788_c0_g1~~TRINITY_DN20788_c0_g1_i1.p1  ORF type:complete len:338 (+),score=51.64 TRINITY_DN20788_c0_g1_i1:85-1098(+)